MKNQMTMANPADFGTVRWAAEKIGCSERWVRDLLQLGTLTRAQPRMGLNESGRRNTLLFVNQVEEYAKSYATVHKGRVRDPLGKSAPTSA